MKLTLTAGAMALATLAPAVSLAAERTYDLPGIFRHRHLLRRRCRGDRRRNAEHQGLGAERVASGRSQSRGAGRHAQSLARLGSRSFQPVRAAWRQRHQADHRDPCPHLRQCQRRIRCGSQRHVGRCHLDQSVASTASGRISQIGNVFVFEQTGPKRLFDSAVAAPGTGLNYGNDAVTDAGFIREGTYADGTPFSWFGFANGDAAAVIRILVVRTDGTPATTEEMATVRRIQCSAEFQGLKLGC